jgi:hypothetical protein
MKIGGKKWDKRANREGKKFYFSPGKIQKVLLKTGLI